MEAQHWMELYGRKQDTYLALKRMERGKVIEEEQLFERKIEGKEGGQEIDIKKFLFSESCLIKTLLWVFSN